MTITSTTSPVFSSIEEVRAAGTAVLKSDCSVVAVYYPMAFGEVVVLRDGSVRLAAEYDAGRA